MKKRHINIPIFVPHKGCPNDCSFCNQKKITGITYDISADDTDTIIRQSLSTISSENTLVEVAFFGGSFTGIPIELQSKLLEVANMYKQKGLIHGIRLSTRPDYIDSGILDMLKSYGVTTIELGAQSMADEVLKANLRGHTRQDTIDASQLIKEYGFDLGLQMMVGLPHDSKANALQTAKEIIKLSPKCVRIYPTLVIKDTLLCNWYEQGLYQPLTVMEATQICKELVIQFQSNHIDVIRLGLMSSEQINMENSVVAGPYHPAFGELVASEILYDKIANQINIGYNLTITIHPKQISKLTGNQKNIIKRLQNQFHINQIEVLQSDKLGEDELIVTQNE